MKRILALLPVLLITFFASTQPLSFYLPDSISYDAAVPKPKDIIHHEVGEWHVTHDRLVNYMKALAAAVPQRVRFETMGFTYEQRPQVLLIITSPSNHVRLEELRLQHLQLTDPTRSATLNTANMPAVVWIGHSIHGNESSGSNASLLSAYYLAAAKGNRIEELLEHTIILLDPSFNPDGLQRFSTWANQHKSKNLVSDPNSREFNEVWPGGRYNHYWFDLNRDWLPVIHVESQNRLEWFHRWKPNILTDHHEQGSNATFFFQPGVPSRVNPLTPEKNQELTAKLGRYHSAFLDRIGSLYFTRENYDDFYYGKGSTYPDINGAIGILFEQASSRGHLLQTNNGALSFPFTIRNQFVTTLSTLEGAHAMRKEFLDYQRDFFKKAVEPVREGTRGYVFGDARDKAATYHFIDMLQRNQVEVRRMNNAWKNENFEAGSAYYVSLDQPQSGLVHTIFDKISQYRDSLFYDITSWTMPLAYGIPYQSFNQPPGAGSVGEKLERVQFPRGELVGGSGNYAYLFEWDEYYAPRALYELQQAGIICRVATNKFQINTGNNTTDFDYGTIQVPVQLQTMTRDQLYSLIQQVAERNGIRIYAVNSGNVETGSDLGSSKFAVVSKPAIAMITGPGVNATDAGEIWHLLDQRMNIPATHLEPAVFNRVDISKYSTLILVGGTYNELNKEKLRAWVQAGGVLILTEEAITWAAQNNINEVKLKTLKPAVDSSRRLPYVQREQVDGAQQMNGVILGAEADLTHPLAYGYNEKTVSLFKSNKVFMEKSKNPYATPYYYGSNALQSGWISRENAEAVKNSAAVIVNAVGNGRVINISDNPNLRAFWLGGSKLFMNAIFFGKLIDAASAR
jgi:hypothetical protein